MILLTCAGCLLLMWPLQGYGQGPMIIYDGFSGLEQVSFRHDTAVISSLIGQSPAERAGMLVNDQIISINDSVVAGQGLSQRGIRSLLLDASDKPLALKVPPEGEERLLSFTLQRDPYLFQIDDHAFMYLVDSLEQWEFKDLQVPPLDTLFRDPLQAKITVFATEPGSPAAQIGLLPGDQIISLADEADLDYAYHIGHDALHTFTSDTSLTVLRGDSLIYFPTSPSQEGNLTGIQSQFEKDFAHSCIWFRITTDNRLSETRIYLLNVPEMKGKDSLNVFYTLPSGEVVEKKSGILFPIPDRDFVYKDWDAVKVTLNKGEQQSFYLRWKAQASVGDPHFQAFAHATVVRFDRFERMVLFGFIFTMLIISAFFLLLFATMHLRQYLYFALYIGSLVIFLFIADGYLDEYFWKENNFFLKFLDKFQPYIMSWISIFFLLFGIAYLELRKALRPWYVSVVVVLSLTGIRIVLVYLEAVFNFSYPAFIEGVFTVVWIFTVGIIPLFILIMPAIIRIRNGFWPAWYFLVANLVLIPLIYITLYYSLSSSSVLSIYESILGRIFVSSGMYIAAILQILIFSFGIAQKMRLDGIERKQIQEQIIQQLKVNEKLKDKVNRELEQKVKERTRQITDSIDYAQRIQMAVLPSAEELDKIMPEYFVFYKPKDIVSGDFYWIKEVNNALIIVAADCTGHGVPGAFMSMLGITLLDEYLGKGSLDAPGEILDNMRLKVKEMLAQKGRIEEQKDGMDMAMAIIDREKKELQFAGANNPLFLIRESRQVEGTIMDLDASMVSNGLHLYELKGDKQPIGVHWEESKFTTHKIPLKDRDSLYVFTDGFIDQFGGVPRKKYKKRRYKELLLSIQNEPMDQQKRLLENALDSWSKDHDQIDDVCIIGVRL
jgi:serine phosphatase RsbU (regulator of sigma subunit)